MRTKRKGEMLRCSGSFRGFTLIEVVVVIVVIGLLAGMLLPAMGAMRESSRLNTCVNNVRQLTLGMLAAEKASKIIPHAGGILDFGNGGQLGSEITAVDGSRVRLSITYAQVGLPLPLALGNPRSSPQEQAGPWSYVILPYIDENVAYQQLKFERQQPLFICPTRGRLQMAVARNDELFTCESGGWRWAKSDYAATTNIGYQRCEQSLARFERYGVDNVILLGEKAMDPFIQPKSSWLYDEPLFIASFGNLTRGGTLMRAVFRDGADADIRHGFGSSHSAGVNFGFLSGRLQTIDFDIDLQVWREMDPDSSNQDCPRIDLRNVN